MKKIVKRILRQDPHTVMTRKEVLFLIAKAVAAPALILIVLMII